MIYGYNNQSFQNSKLISRSTRAYSALHGTIVSVLYLYFFIRMVKSELVHSIAIICAFVKYINIVFNSDKYA